MARADVCELDVIAISYGSYSLTGTGVGSTLSLSTHASVPSLSTASAQATMVGGSAARKRTTAPSAVQKVRSRSAGASRRVAPARSATSRGGPISGGRSYICSSPACTATQRGLSRIDPLRDACSVPLQRAPKKAAEPPVLPPAADAADTDATHALKG